MIFNQSEVTKTNLKKEMRGLADRLNVTDISQTLFFPKYFQIETIRICNAHCPFCPVDEWDKSTPLMSQPLYDKIVEELSDYSDWIEMVSVQRAGEPLLDKKLVPRIKQLKEAGIRFVTIATNASRLFETKARELLEAGLDEIMISIDSIDREGYEKSRVGLDYDTVMTNIETFFKVREEVNPNMRVRVRGVSFYDMENLLHRNELQRWEDFWSRFQKPQDQIYMKKAHNWGNQKSWDGHTPDYDHVFHPCVLPWSTMHITAMGIVALCPQDYDAKMNIGDINTTSIQEVWNNYNWTRIRKLHSSGNRNDIEMCIGCRLFDLDNNLKEWRDQEAV